MRRTRRRPSTAIHAPAPTTGRHRGPTSLYQPMSEADVDLIIETSITLLARSGVVFEPGTEADRLLAAAGGHLPPPLRRGLLTTLPFARAAVACGHVPTAREEGGS